jgi:geranylgeranylglycerol-phosphate geranylgeranyltransferase
MVNFSSYIKIIRPGNAAMTSVAVILGAWLAGAWHAPLTLVMLAFSAFCAAGFGNVVNDILDIDADKINHPGRPLPSGAMRASQAMLLAVILAAASLTSGWSVSAQHLSGCAIPLILLWVYAVRLKATPLAGNIVVSILVAYAIAYGGIGAPGFFHLLIPALLAFLLNFSREIVKDLQDRGGDMMHGVITTAILPESVIRIIMSISGALYALFLFVPFALGHFGSVYLILCAAVLVPLHAVWMYMFLRRPVNADALARVSTLIKWEMLCGLAAVGIDRLF